MVVRRFGLFRIVIGLRLASGSPPTGMGSDPLVERIP
jgi:hypothetical protein